MPRGAFSLKEENNDDLSVKYYPKDTITKFVKAQEDDALKESSQKLPKHLSALDFEGIYLNQSEPLNFYHALYVSKSDPNTVCIVTFTVPGANIIGAIFYSDKAKNPLKEENIQF